MPVTRYRSVEEMSRPWRDAHSPENLRLVARMLSFYRSLARGTPRPAGVQRRLHFRQIGGQAAQVGDAAQLLKQRGAWDADDHMVPGLQPDGRIVVADHLDQGMRDAHFGKTCRPGGAIQDDEGVL